MERGGVGRDEEGKGGAQGRCFIWTCSRKLSCFLLNSRFCGSVN